MNNELFNTTVVLFSKVLGVQVLLEKKMTAYYFDSNFIDRCERHESVGVKMYRSTSWRRRFGVFIPDHEKYTWYEIQIKDFDMDGVWKPEDLRYSEIDRIERFLNQFGKEKFSGSTTEEFLVRLGNIDYLREVMTEIMTENVKNGRSV